MSCKHNERLLSALSDGELHGFTAWRLRRHLAHCPACAALYADIERVNAAARTLRDATATAQPASSLVNHVQQHIAEPAPSAEPDASVLNPVFERKDDSMYSANVSTLPLRNPVRRPAWRQVAIVSALIVFPIAFVFGARLLMFSLTPLAAFADVERAIEEIQIAHIRFQMKTGITAGEEKIDPQEITVYDAWLRADPPAFAMTLPGNVRLVGGRTGTTMRHPEGGVHQVSTTPITREDVRKVLLSPEKMLENKPGQPVVEWSAPTTVAGPNGRTLLRFESNQSDAKRVLFADPTSHRPIRLEVAHQTQTPAGDAEPVAVGMEFTVDFAYNETPPKGTFDTPPISKKQPAVEGES